MPVTPPQYVNFIVNRKASLILGMTTSSGLQDALGRVNKLYQVLENRVMAILVTDANDQIL